MHAMCMVITMLAIFEGLRALLLTIPFCWWPLSWCNKWLLIARLCLDNCCKWKVNRYNLVCWDSWKVLSRSTIYWQIYTVLYLQKAKNFSVESIWNKLVKQDTKCCFKKWWPVLSILLVNFEKNKNFYSISKVRVSPSWGGLEYPPTTRKIALPPPMSPHCFAQKIMIM